MPPLSELQEDLLACLRVTTKRKTASELTEEVGERWKERGKRQLVRSFLSLISEDLAEMAGEPSMGSVYVALEKFLSQGWVEWRWRKDPPDVLARRGGYRKMEWCLTEGGRRVLEELFIAQQARNLSAAPVPA